MTEMHRFRVRLGGWTGAPGLNTWYMRYPAPIIPDDLAADAVLLRTAYDALKGKLAQGVTVDIDPIVDQLNDSTGTLTGSVAITPPAQVVGTDTGRQLSRATMVLARLNTDAIVDGRRLRGRIFLGPAGSSCLDTNGQVTAATVTAVSSAFAGLLDVVAGRIVVWHRPTSPGGSDGTTGFVQNVGCKPVPAVLRSRRD